MLKPYQFLLSKHRQLFLTFSWGCLFFLIFFHDLAAQEFFTDDITQLESLPSVFDDGPFPLPPLEDELSIYMGDDPSLNNPEVGFRETNSNSLFRDIVTDHGQFYSRHSLGLMVLGLGAGAALANTNADDFISRDFYQESIRNADTDEYFEAMHNMKIFGEGKYGLPIYALAMGGGWILDESEFFDSAGEWGERSLRTVLVGGPPMLAAQWIVGGSRPGESHSNSHWEPFQDNNGVSGHAFMGAIPFLNAANMTDNPWLRGACYVGSGMAGLSRINDDSHYTSQAVLGWWFAYLAARSVNNTELENKFTPLVQFSPDGTSLFGVEYRW
jgi:hypothetical protein